MQAGVLWCKRQNELVIFQKYSSLQLVVGLQVVRRAYVQFFESAGFVLHHAFHEAVLETGQGDVVARVFKVQRDFSAHHLGIC